MGNDMLLNFNVRRVNRFNAILIWGLSALLSAQAFIISSISGEHAASSEEILASTEEQNQRIIEVTREMATINDLSNQLGSMLDA